MSRLLAVSRVSNTHGHKAAKDADWSNRKCLWGRCLTLLVQGLHQLKPLDIALKSTATETEATAGNFVHHDTQLETCTSIVPLRYRKDAYDMLMLWISSQSFTQNARSSLITTDLASSLRSRNGLSNGGNANKKALYYTPWNRRFFMWYKGRLLVFRREYRAREFSSREEVTISCFGRSPYKVGFGSEEVFGRDKQ
ncbi:BCS1 N terminal-domain-containing protein [Amylocarpus encephaloides]|uniref:BCS1 N terminal-domain-containing protein n=1 Tax=Amylocarpus encephaloides TaxID=45428 RepID=A0A9P7YB16_9HELO|nr:BCS1 N terminal-domain-containing protein [Amylocarpus encephaloides]